jgi:ATPase family associated with various cellular activities (AAA)
MTALVPVSDEDRNQPSLLRLCELRARVSKLVRTHWDSVLHFAIEAAVPADRDTRRREIRGFVNLAKEKPHSDARVSLASTATCVRSLRMCTDRNWAQLDFTALAEEVRDRYSTERLATTGLEHLNPFTVGQLGPVLSYVGITPDEELVQACKEKLSAYLADRGVSLRGFPPNSYLSYWVLAAARTVGLAPTPNSALVEWSRQELYRHLALLSAGDEEEGDAFQLAYSLVIQAAFDPRGLRPSIIFHALTEVARAQLPRGVWEKKEPLFVWEKQGDAYCFSFELLSTLLLEFRERYAQLVPFEKALERSLEWAERNAHADEISGTSTWRSGHRTESRLPESWATAEVYTFLRCYEHYLDYRINATLLSKYRGQGGGSPQPDVFSDFYLPEVRNPNRAARANQPLLNEVMTEQMLSPLRLDDATRQFSLVHSSEFSLSRNMNAEHCIRSCILFGPPGTGKTSFVKAVAKYLGWAIIILDPSDFAAEGLHLLPTTIGQIFNDLREARDTVIFLDEMEELMRDRRSDNHIGQGEPTFEQRLLTTALLPKLQDLHDRAHSLFFVATNHFSRIDEAARRFGRFDLTLEMLPACFNEKCRQIADDLSSLDGFRGADASPLAAALSDALRDLATDPERAEEREKLEWATFAEVRSLVHLLHNEVIGGKAPEAALITALAHFHPALKVDEWRDGYQYNKTGSVYWLLADHA